MDVRRAVEIVEEITKHDAYGNLFKLIEEMQRAHVRGEPPRIGQMGALFQMSDNVSEAVGAEFTGSPLARSRRLYGIWDREVGCWGTNGNGDIMCSHDLRKMAAQLFMVRKTWGSPAGKWAIGIIGDDGMPDWEIER